MKAITCLIICFGALLCLAGCGSSQSDFTAISSADSSSDAGVSGQTATVTLQSELVLNKAISSDISSIVFTTKSSSGATVFQSAAVEKTPVIKVEVPVESKHLQLDYLDASQATKEIWGSPLPDLKPGDEVIIRQPNPERLDNLASLEILGPSRIPPGRTQFRAQATFSDGTVKEVTNSVTWAGGVSPDGIADFTGQTSQTVIRVTASLGSLNATKSALVLPIATQGLPFLLAGGRTSDAPVSSLTLNGYAETRPVFVFSNFADGVIREVTPQCVLTSQQPNVFTVDSRRRLVSVAQGSGPLTVRLGRQSISIPVQVLDRPSLSVFENVSETLQSVTDLTRPLLLHDMNGDGRADLVAFPTGDVSKLSIAPTDGEGFGPSSSVELPFTNSPEARPLLFAGNVSGTTRVGTIGPFLAVGCSNSNTVAVITRGRSGFSVSEFNLGSPAVELSQMPFSSDTAVRERLLARSAEGRVRVIEVGVGGSTDITVPDLQNADRLVGIRNGRGNALVAGRGNALRVHSLNGSSIVSSTTLSLPTGSSLTDLRTVSDARGTGFDVLAQSGSTRSLFRYRVNNDVTSNSLGGFTTSRVDGLPSDAVLTPYSIVHGSERLFNIVTSSSGVPHLALDDRSEPLDSYATLQVNPFAAGDLNADGFDDLVILEGSTLRVLLLGRTL